MGEIDQPALKEILWHKMQSDLRSLVPWFSDNDRLLCPICCRPLTYDDLSLEHIIPKQALAKDPAEAKAAIPRNERSGMTLLCRKPLLIRNQPIYNNGCNSWKGKHYDSFLRDVFVEDILRKNKFTSRHHVALFCAGYLGLFRKFGYQIVLLPSGLVMRNQFFRPNSFLPDVPIKCQMVLTGEGRSDYSEETSSYWSDPFDFSIDNDVALMSVRNFVLPLPISRDPTAPLARALPYAPSRYKLRPDLRTAFD